MRKKYLSALLFGALLVTSAGTFTSCKDYDDDIKNLQEQIDVIKTDLASLTETVNNLDGVKDMSFADGKLVIETGKGKKVEVDIPSASGITKVELKDNVLYVNDEPHGEVVIPEDELVKVEVKEDGKLYINDEVQDLEIGSKVVMVDNGDYYTMTIDGKESYNLPKYNAAVNISKLTLLIDNLTFGFNSVESTGSNISPILWGYKSSKVDWAGPKGNVAANQIMVGQIGKATDAIEVSPASIDLTTMELKLVDSKGNVAPVKVTPVANTGLAVGSRAASTDGKWSLAIEMTEDVNKDNIYSYFYNLDPNNAGYKLYALQVNGIVMTGYDIAVKVDDENIATAAVFTNGELSGDNGAKFTASLLNNVTITNAGSNIQMRLTAGKTTTLYYSDADCYDSYVSFEGTNKAHADKLGIKAEGMKITVPSTAVNLSSADLLYATINVLNVDGTINSKTTLQISTTGSATEDEVELATTSVKVMPTTETVKIDLTKAIEGMTDAQIEDVNTLKHIQVKQIAGNEFLNNVEIKYYTAKDKELVDVAAEGKETYTDLRQISYAKLTIDNLVLGIKAGDYKLIMTMYNEANVASGNTTASEVRKVTIPVSISIPTFDELFPKSAAWNDNTAKLIADVDGKANLMTLYTDKTGVTGGDEFTKVTVKQGTNGAIEDYQEGDENVITLTETAVDANSNTFKALTASVEYTYNNITLESGNFDVQMITGLNGGKFVYYNENGEAADLTINATSGSFDAFTAADSDTKKKGLAFVYGGKDYAFKKGNKVGVFTLGDVSSDDIVSITFDGQQGSNAKAEFGTGGKLFIEGLASGNYTTNMTVTYKQASKGSKSPSGQTYVYESFTVPVKVNF